MNLNKYISAIKFNTTDKVGFSVSLAIFLYLLGIKSIESVLTPNIYGALSSILVIVLFYLLGLKLWCAKKLDRFIFCSIFLAIIWWGLTLLFLKGILISGDNNDIYSWALSSNYLMGLSDYSKIIPYGAYYWLATFGSDAFGSYVLNGLFASIFKSNTLYFTSLNIFIILISYQLSIYYLLKNNGIRKEYSFLGSIFWISNPFFIYLVSNYFLGQLIAGLFLFIGLNCYSEAMKNSYSRYKRVLSILPSIFIIFISYQSAFILIIFAFFLISFFLQEVNKSSQNQFSTFINNYALVRKISIDLLITLFLCVVLSLETAEHLIYQTLFAAKILAGWSLPLINPLTLVGLPTSLPVQSKTSFYTYLAFIIFMTFTFGLKNIFKIKKGTYSLVILFLLLIIYSCGDLIINRGNNYQVWKAASFVILPYGFVVTIFVLSQFLSGLKDSKLLIILIPSFVISSSSYYLSSSTYFKAHDDFFNSMVRLKYEILSAAPKSIILTTGPYKETMIAFNIFSDIANIYPLNKTYIPEIDFNYVNLNEAIMIAKNCEDQTKSIYFMTDDWKHLFTYNFANGCGLLKNVFDYSGLYEPEQIGSWSSGKVVTFNFDLNKYNFFKPSKIKFFISPFLPRGVNYQDLVVIVDSKKISSKRFYNDFEIEIEVDDKKSFMNITFMVDQNYKPKDYNKISEDDRTIALLFKKVKYEF
jgi:hypothetical protein